MRINQLLRTSSLTGRARIAINIIILNNYLFSCDMSQDVENLLVNALYFGVFSAPIVFIISPLLLNLFCSRFFLVLCFVFILRVFILALQDLINGRH